jgi:hypothetical protein
MIFVNRTADDVFGVGFFVEAAGAPEGRDQLVVTAAEAPGFVHQCPPISEDGAWEPFDDDAKKAVADAVAELEDAKAEPAATDLGVSSPAASAAHDALTGAVATATATPGPAAPAGAAEPPPEPTGEAAASTEGKS